MCILVTKGSNWELENFLFKNPKKMNIIRDGTGKFKKLKSQKSEHYDSKNEERDESLVLFFVGRKKFNIIIHSLKILYNMSKSSEYKSRRPIFRL